ncbi:hypothetical protein B0G81_1771 [Paraburkholderia sp. BL6665CI2N2]|nr:hypothetical protein B0G81_1771 [Paraburkholderia sp. BL6665CI2N2]
MTSLKIRSIACESEQAARVVNVAEPPQTSGIHLADSPKPSLEIEVFLDFICPWCLIGVRNLRVAMKRLNQLRPEAELKVEDSRARRKREKPDQCGVCDGNFHGWRMWLGGCKRSVGTWRMVGSMRLRTCRRAVATRTSRGISPTQKFRCRTSSESISHHGWSGQMLNAVISAGLTECFLWPMTGPALDFYEGPLTESERPLE